MLEGGGEVILMGGVVIEGTLVVEAGTTLHAEGPVLLTSTMQLDIVLLAPVEDDTTIEIIVCTPLEFRCTMLICAAVFSPMTVFFLNELTSCFYSESRSEWDDSSERSSAEGLPGRVRCRGGRPCPGYPAQSFGGAL